MPLFRYGFVVSVLFVAVTLLVMPSCTTEKDHDTVVLDQYLQTADSLVIVGKASKVAAILLKHRARFNDHPPQLSLYHTYMSASTRDNSVATRAYADSALMLFDDKSNTSKYPDEYFKALLNKGDALIAAKQYGNALEYYYKAKNLPNNGKCDNGNLAMKIAYIYFNQQNYNSAVRWWIQSYERIHSCSTGRSPQLQFFLIQSALDNIGVSYQRVGMYDSAAYYYKKDLAYINATEKEGIVNKNAIIAPRAVVYDNLGGLYVKLNNLPEAERYLTASVTIPEKDTDGMRIPPFVKRAELYMNTGRYALAAADLASSRRLLNIYGKDNPISAVEWYRLSAQYLFGLHRTDSAFRQQAKYMHLKDSLDKTNAQLRSLDLDRELRAIHRENLLAELEHNQKVERLYMWGISGAVILLLVISISIALVLKQSRKNHRDAQLHNEQLQLTLAELELANKNTTRIMRVMAHDLRNPLFGMIGLASAILEEEPSEESKHMLKLLEATGSHSLEMINELLRSGLSDENEPMIKQQMDIKELLHDSVELLQFKANEKKQQIIFKSDDKPVIVAINHEKIWRVFNNLIVNAIKFSYESGVITVSIKAGTRDKKVLISIADNGIGIPEKNSDKIFEMFTSAKREGTDGEQAFGLGLYISKRIITNHGGKLWFDSEDGKGTTFYIELPV